MIMIGVLKMNKADIDYIIEKLDSYKPDNIYDGYNSVKEKQDQRVSEVLDSLKVEFESDYENGHTPMPKELVLTCKLDEEQMQRLKEQIESAKMSIESVKESKWIKCSDRMPDNIDDVLYCDDKSEIRCGFYNKNYNWWQSGSGVLKSCYVTHWMPLPELPEEEEK